MPGSIVPASPAGGSEETGQSMPGSFGRYRPLAPLGGGAMGMVYKAHDPSIDRVVAVNANDAATIRRKLRTLLAAG